MLLKVHCHGYLGWEEWYFLLEVLGLEGVASSWRKELLTQLRPHLNRLLSHTHHTFYKWPHTRRSSTGLPWPWSDPIMTKMSKIFCPRHQRSLAGSWNATPCCRRGDDCKPPLPCHRPIFVKTQTSKRLSAECANHTMQRWRGSKQGAGGCWFTFSVPGWQSGTCRYKSGTQSYTKVHSRYTKARTGTQRYTPGRFTGKQKLWRNANLIYYITQWYIRERFGEPVNAVPAQNVCKMGEKYAQRVQNVHKIGAK